MNDGLFADMVGRLLDAGWTVTDGHWHPPPAAPALIAVLDNLEEISRAGRPLVRGPMGRHSVSGSGPCQPGRTPPIMAVVRSDISATLRTDWLECGHRITSPHGPYRPRRRCDQCADPHRLGPAGVGIHQGEPMDTAAAERLRTAALEAVAAWDAEETLERQDLSEELHFTMERLRAAAVWPS